MILTLIALILSANAETCKVDAEELELAKAVYEHAERAFLVGCTTKLPCVFSSDSHRGLYGGIHWSDTHLPVLNDLLVLEDVYENGTTRGVTLNIIDGTLTDGYEFSMGPKFAKPYGCLILREWASQAIRNYF